MVMKKVLLVCVGIMFILVIAFFVQAEDVLPPEEITVLPTAPNGDQIYSLGYGTPTTTQAVPEFSLRGMLALSAIVVAILAFRKMRNP